MSKVTSKLQVTIPKSIARQYSIRPRDSISFQAAGDVIRVLPPNVAAPAKLDRLTRLWPCSMPERSDSEPASPSHGGRQPVAEDGPARSCTPRGSTD